ncbi:hypothetical protein [Phaeobacter sp. HF9A]|uniref:hypothetical protein n=1 Tax=Phaeobacter sp. HF9A TaxID=2721561 RepID=UPI00158EE5DF|nr:hypothetical protein [Phaeobacter sp. HF9A]
MDTSSYLLPVFAIVLGRVTLCGSPGPATLTICGTAMAEGRRAGLLVAALVARRYGRSKRGFEAAFGLLFGAASLNILTLRLT